jgi:hypothetical protein
MMNRMLNGSALSLSLLIILSLLFGIDGASTSVVPSVPPTEPSAVIETTDVQEIPFIHHLIVKVGDALRWCAQRVIHMVTNFFEAMMH